MNKYVGTWVGPDEYTSEVEYSVFESGSGLEVTAVDPSDEERATITDVEITDEALTFTAEWHSTGRVCMCILQVLSGDVAKFTFTFTDNVMLVRKNG